MGALTTNATAQHWRSSALSALVCRTPAEKLLLTAELYNSVRTEPAPSGCFTVMLQEPVGLPGCPQKPQLLAHLDVQQQSIFTPRGLAALVHAVCHIEFNAINLALDAVWRFAAMPEQYYAQWIRIAAEEAHHFTLLVAHLKTLGYEYGDFPAHTGLWDMVERTKGDIVARMALVPRTLEARGLDATPPMQAKLRKVGTPQALRAVDILDIILRDEIGHVAVGNYWYRWLCERDGIDPISHFRTLCEQHSAPRARAPINQEARRLAGFTNEEICDLLLNS